MSVTGIENQSNQSVSGDFQSTANQPWSSNQRTHRGDRHWDRYSGDDSDSRYTPSSASASQSNSANAGTYQVSQVQVFSASALILLAQNGSPSASSAQTTPSTATSTTPAAQTQAATPQSVQPAVTQTAAATTSASSDSSSSAQGSLQTLNTILQSLGLNQQDIQAFDQVASLIQSFSPTAFADLVNLFQNLAQQISPASQSASSASDPASTAAATPAAPATTPSSTTAPTGDIEVEELSIRLSGLNIQGATESSSGNNGSAGGTFDITALQLNVSEIDVTLAPSSAQTASSQPPATTASTGQTTAASAASAA